MAMNFVTFNQDYSYLAVGTHASTLFRVNQLIMHVPWLRLTSVDSDAERIPYLHDGSLCEELRD